MRFKISSVFISNLYLKKHWIAVLVVLFLSLVLNIIGLTNYIYTKTVMQNEQSFQAQKSKYPLLATRVLLENPVDVLVSFLSLRNNLKNELAPWGDSFGMYFEYLPTGT